MLLLSGVGEYVLVRSSDGVDDGGRDGQDNGVAAIQGSGQGHHARFSKRSTPPLETPNTGAVRVCAREIWLLNAQAAFLACLARRHPRFGRSSLS